VLHVSNHPRQVQGLRRIPKANGYQFLTLFDPFTPLEAQIRTHDMHRVAEAGVAAHWLYKAGGALDLAEAQRETSRWLQSLLEIQSESGDSKEFLEHIKGALFPDEIYVFTPKGKIMALPRGAGVDAYGVHTTSASPVAARIALWCCRCAPSEERRSRRNPASPRVQPSGSRLRHGQRRSHPHYLKGCSRRSAALATAAGTGAGRAQGRAEAITWIAGSPRQGIRRRASSTFWPASGSAASIRSSSRKRSPKSPASRTSRRRPARSSVH
jgi:hypothetical protein